MICPTFTDRDRAALAAERYLHPHPKVGSSKFSVGFFIEKLRLSGCKTYNFISNSWA
jgi:hypothetical protein